MASEHWVRLGLYTMVGALMKMGPLATASPPLTVIDIGAKGGSGRAFLPENSQYVGVNSKASKVGVAKLGVRDVLLEVDFLGPQPLPTGFDVGICHNLTRYPAEDWGRIIQKMIQAVRPAGKLYLGSYATGPDPLKRAIGTKLLNQVYWRRFIHGNEANVAVGEVPGG